MKVATTVILASTNWLPWRSANIVKYVGETDYTLDSRVDRHSSMGAVQQRQTGYGLSFLVESDFILTTTVTTTWV